MSETRTTTILTSTCSSSPRRTGDPAPFDERVAAVGDCFASPRFDGIVRLYTSRQVVEQQGSAPMDFPVAREAALAFYARLRQLFAERRQITTFGPYSPGQAVIIKRLGIEGIYLGGWAVSAKGGVDRGSGRRPGELSAQPGARRGRGDGAGSAGGRQEPVLRATPDDAGAARGHARDRLPPLHHRRRRHRTRRRRAGAEPDPPVRRGRRPRLPHRGPEARREEMRPSGRQGARGRATSRSSGSTPPASSST